MLLVVLNKRRRRRRASLFKTIFVLSDTEGDRNGEEDRDGNGDRDEKENTVQRGGDRDS